MLPQSDPVWTVLIFGTFACLLFVGFIFAFVYRYQQKMIQHQQDLMHKEEANQMAQIAAAIEGQEREQKRLARELHDGVGADISFIKNMLMHAGAMEDKSVASGLVAEAADALNQTFLQVRQISHNFIPQMLEDIGLQSGLGEMCKLVNKSGIVTATFEADENIPALPAEKKLLLYRIIQELVQNAVKHSGAASIKVKLSYSGSELSATVYDDGCGFDTTAPDFKRGIGLKNIENRALLLGAGLEIYASPDKGTTAIVKFTHA